MKIKIFSRNKMRFLYVSYMVYVKTSHLADLKVENMKKFIFDNKQSSQNAHGNSYGKCNNLLWRRFKVSKTAENTSPIQFKNGYLW